jgi:NAD(P)-dependent dehydrogenase (short-subunit alcohol dehydrogenase family)
MEGMEGRVALITGASRGVGAAVARAFSERGAKLGLLSRSGDDLGLPDALGVACDVRSREAVFAATAQVVERFGSLDCVVANAGMGAYGPFLELAPEHLEEMIDLNLKGTLYTAAATLPHLIAADGGDFVSLASVAGLRGFPGEAVYNASKFGQLGFTRALDHEMREHGVRCTNVAPGGIATDFALETGRPREVLEGMMSADEAAEAVVFCVTRPRSYRMLTMSYRPMSEPSWG